ncbi:MAG: hypothetical protein KC646_05480 [Candidatus Cloacimonetes bacterium]|nr:hypothetical protein [Candidatus Cloacimonadota bacterium]
MSKFQIFKLLLCLFLVSYIYLHFSRCFGTCARQNSNARACVKNQDLIQSKLSQTLDLGFYLNDQNSLEFYALLQLDAKTFKDPGFSEENTYRSDVHGNVWCVNHAKGWTPEAQCSGPPQNQCNKTRNEILPWYDGRYSFYKSVLVYLRDKNAIDFIEDPRKL